MQTMQPDVLQSVTASRYNATKKTTAAMFQAEDDITRHTQGGVAGWPNLLYAPQIYRAQSCQHALQRGVKRAAMTLKARCCCPTCQATRATTNAGPPSATPHPQFVTPLCRESKDRCSVEPAVIAPRQPMCLEAHTRRAWGESPGC